MVFNYKRVSTTQQNTERQLRNVPCDREVVEYASGKDTNRPKFRKMMSIIQEGDQINVHELSRLARNTQDLLSIVNEIMDKGASIHFIKENLFLNGRKRKDPFQNLMLSMLGAISTFERDLLLGRQREGIEIAKKKGKYKGRPSKFTSDQVAEIRRMFDKSTNRTELARELGISRGYLYQMVS